MIRYLSRLFLFQSLLVLLSCSAHEPVELTLDEVREVGYLELATVTTEEVVVIKGNSVDLWGIRSLEEIADKLSTLLRVGDRVGVYSFDREVSAYLDLDKLAQEDLRIDPRSHSVSIVLPAVEVRQKGRLPELRVLHERVTGTRESITPSERRAICEKACDLSASHFAPGAKGYERLVGKAKEKGREFFKQMFAQQGYTDIQITYREP